MFLEEEIRVAVQAGDAEAVAVACRSFVRQATGLSMDLTPEQGRAVMEAYLDDPGRGGETLAELVNQHCQATGQQPDPLAVLAGQVERALAGYW